MSVLDFPTMQPGVAAPDQPYRGFWWDGWRWNRLGWSAGGGEEPVEDHDFFADFRANRYNGGIADGLAWLTSVNAQRTGPIKWINVNGVMQTVAANAMPFSPGRGVMLDPAGTNVATAMNTSWFQLVPLGGGYGYSLPNAPFTANAGISPSGLNDAWAPAWGTQAWQHWLRAPLIPTYQQSVFSMFLKGVGNVRYVYIASPTQDIGAGATAVVTPNTWSPVWTCVDLQTGQMTHGAGPGVMWGTTLPGSWIAGGVERLNEGWSRIWHVRANPTRTATGNDPSVVFGVSNSATIDPTTGSLMQVPFTPVAGDQLLFWGFQPEVLQTNGPPFTSLMRWGTAPGAPRPADSFVIPATATASELWVNGVNVTGQPDTSWPRSMVRGGFANGLLETVAWDL